MTGRVSFCFDFENPLQEFLFSDTVIDSPDIRVLNFFSFSLFLADNVICQDDGDSTADDAAPTDAAAAAPTDAAADPAAADPTGSADAAAADPAGRSFDR